jgi:two-component system, LuxR family, response regulator FixJ
MDQQGLIYAVDDDSAVLRSLEALLSQHNYEVRCYASAVEFLQSAPLEAAACLITDVRMPVISGAELLQRLNAAGSPISTIVVTGVADVPTAVALMENGAVTLLEKPYDQAILLKAVARGLEASQKLWQKQQAKQSIGQRLQTLSEEEQQVLQFMLSGEPNKTISSKLDLSMRTVDRRRQTILKKMKVQSLPELAMLVGRAG